MVYKTQTRLLSILNEFLNYLGKEMLINIMNESKANREQKEQHKICKKTNKQTNNEKAC